MSLFLCPRSFMNYKKALGRDPRLKKYLEHKIVVPEPSANITQGLVWSILSQQLSIQVAKVMCARFLKLFGGRFPSAVRIKEMPIEKIRAIGISESKARYIHNVAQFIADQKVTRKKLERLSDDEVIRLLSQIKGVGRWTVEMLLIFTLGRQDVFAVDDLGIQKAMKEIFKLQDLSPKDLRLKMLELSRPWSPYRSYVCLHFWNYSSLKK